jgi:hypothetical protein
VLNAIQAGRAFLQSIQRTDGSWYGSWGNCFTYGTWFGIEGLVCAGEATNSDSVQRAVRFLLSKQNANGGWGESYLACINKAYPAEGTGEVGQSESHQSDSAYPLYPSSPCPSFTQVNTPLCSPFPLCSAAYFSLLLLLPAAASL